MKQKVGKLRSIFLCMTLLVVAPGAMLYAQSAADVLESGKEIGKDDMLFFQINSSADTLKSHLGPDLRNALPVSPSIIMLTRETGVNVFINPLNPLKYSTKTSQEFIPDKAEKQASDALSALVSSIDGIVTKQKAMLADNKSGRAKSRSLISKGTKGQSGGSDETFAQYLNQKDVEEDNCNTKLTAINTIAKELGGLLGKEKENKDKINSIFNDLRNLQLTDNGFKAGLDADKTQMDVLKTDYFDVIDAKIKAFAEAISSYSCTNERSEMDKFVLLLMIDKFQGMRDNQYKRYNNLNNAYLLVKREFDACDGSGKNALKQLGTIVVSDGQVTDCKLTIMKSGYEVVDGEIVKSTESTAMTYNYKIKKFKRFVVEVAAGIANVDLTFPKYATTTDAAGQQYVAPPTEDIFKKVNVTTMLNFNYFLPSWQVIPFFQVGVGVNTDYPTLFTGVGFRLNMPPVKRIALSLGYASTWIKTLDKLHVGDKVNGQADIDNDIKYEFHWPLAPYLGIQYNF